MPQQCLPQARGLRTDLAEEEELATWSPDDHAHSLACRVEGNGRKELVAHFLGIPLDLEPTGCPAEIRGPGAGARKHSSGGLP